MNRGSIPETKGTDIFGKWLTDGDYLYDSRNGFIDEIIDVAAKQEEEAIQKTLIGLGWIPPERAKAIESEIESLRETLGRLLEEIMVKYT